MYKRILVNVRLVEALRDVLQGITAYARGRRLDWRIQCVDAVEFARNLQPRSVDGIITVISPQSKVLLNRVQRLGVKAVNLFHNVEPFLTSVVSDDVGIGSAGAQYFLQGGFRNFAFVGIGSAWSRDRRRGFSAALAEVSRQRPITEAFLQFRDHAAIGSARARRQLRQWLARLPRPSSVMACSDRAARAVLDACLEARIQVPADIAVLGVDNLVVTCEFAPVPLSSVAQNFTKLGMEAARQLDRLMMRRRPPCRPVIVPAGSVVARQSTDRLAFDDEIVAAAMKIILVRASAGLGVKELVRIFDLSRKSLDLRFKAAIGRTPSQEIRRIRLNLILDLLLNTTLSVREIARRCGFSNAENLIRFFRDEMGMPPQRYRDFQRS